MSSSLEAKLQLDIAHFQTQLAKARGEAKKFRDQLQSQGGFGKMFGSVASLGAVASLGVGMTALIRRGMEFNQTIGDSETAIANVLRQFKGLSVEAAKQEAARAMKAMVDLEPQTAASLTGLVDGFMATLGASQSVGISVEQNIDLVGKFSNALANSALPAEQLAQEMRSIMTGTIGADSSLAKVLTISNADISKAQQAGKLYEFLVGKIGVLGEAGDTAAVALSSLNSAIDKAAGALTKGLFDQAVAGAKDLAVALEENADTFEQLGRGAAQFVEWLIKGAGKAKDIGNALGAIGFAMAGDSSENVDPKLMENLNKRGMTGEAAAIENGRVGNRGTFAEGAMAQDIVDRERARNAPASGKSGGGGTGGGGSAPDAKELLAAHREIVRLQEMEDALAAKRFDDYLSILPPNLKLIEVQREMLRLAEERDQLTGPGFDERRLQIESELLALRKQGRDAEKDIADEKERAAEKQKEEDEKAGKQAAALALFEQEMDLINAKLAGNKELTAELERHAAIQQLMNQLLDDTNLSEQEALQKATQMVDAKKDLADKDKEKDGKIKGYSRERQGGADEARDRAEERVKGSRDSREQKVKDTFGSFKDEDQRLKDKFADEFGGAGKPKDPAANPLAPQAQKNALKEQPQAPDSSNAQLGQQVLQIMQQMLGYMQ